MSFPKYSGPLNSKKMSYNERIAYEAYNGAKARSKKAGLCRPEMGAREFIGWWIHSLKAFSGTTATCGRIDHSKGYSWDNIEMQDMAENSREGMIRNKTHLNTAIKFGKKIVVSCKHTGNDIAVFSSIRDTAKTFSVSQRLIQFLIRNKYKKSSKINFNLRSVN